MKLVLSLFICLLSCTNNDVNTQIDDAYSLLDSSYVEFRAGNNNVAKSIAHDVLSVGIKLENDTLTGDALTSLCRTALRDNNSADLDKYSTQLRELSEKTKDETWLMIQSHMNAEIARRLFKEQNIIPDPADEKPLNNVEEAFENKLSPIVKDSLASSAMNLSVKLILDKYLN